MGAFQGGLAHSQSYNPAMVMNQMAGMNLATTVPAGGSLGPSASAPTQLTGAPAAGTTTEAAATSFNASASAFIPKKKMVKTEDTFPTLDMAADSAPKKKAVVTKKNDEAPKKSSDPCQGKPAAFFHLVATNPMFAADEFNNPRIVSDEQQKFLFVHYPEYAPNMHELFDWLYATAVY